MKLPHTSKRPAQVEIKTAIIQVRVLTYMRTTPHSIRTVEDILWSFPEKFNEQKDHRGFKKWKWSQIKGRITKFMCSPKMAKEWRLSSSAHEGAVRQWTRIPKAPAAVLEEVRA